MLELSGCGRQQAIKHISRDRHPGAPRCPLYRLLFRWGNPDLKLGSFGKGAHT
jgi:hypothetical protein